MNCPCNFEQRVGEINKRDSIKTPTVKIQGEIETKIRDMINIGVQAEVDNVSLNKIQVTTISESIRDTFTDFTHYCHSFKVFYCEMFNLYNYQDCEISKAENDSLVVILAKGMNFMNEFYRNRLINKTDESLIENRINPNQIRIKGENTQFQNITQHRKYSGVISDSKTNKKIEKAKIYYDGMLLGFSDDEGYFSVELNLEGDLLDVLTITILKEGYKREELYVYSNLDFSQRLYFLEQLTCSGSHIS